MHRFTATLYSRHDGQVTMYLVDVPNEITDALGPKKQVWIRGTVDGAPFETTLLPKAEGGSYLILNGETRKQAGAKLGKDLNLAIEPNPVPRNRELSVPEDLAAVLEEFPEVKDAFGRLSKSRRYYLIEYIEEARKPETRIARIEKSLKEIVRLAPKKN